jgi:hypothetical protein
MSPLVRSAGRKRLGKIVMAALVAAIYGLAFSQEKTWMAD